MMMSTPNSNTTRQRNSGDARGTFSSNLPLYNSARQQNVQLAPNSNCGLLYDKFCDLWSSDWRLENKEGKQSKQSWINNVVRMPCGNKELIKSVLERYQALVAACGGQIRFMCTTSRFVTGIGREHPVENGFAWHHLLGTPYLPGSSVKGVVRDWAAHWQQVDHHQIDRCFGPEGDGVEKCVGDLIFFDALPVRPVKLEMEVMTPHYSPYYQSEGQDMAPGDWYSPIPIPYLTVAAGQTFIFGVAPRSRGKDVGEAVVWLEEAFGAIGAGSKTASGYGIFEPDPEYQESNRQMAPRQQEKENQTIEPEQNFTPIRSVMETDNYSNSNQQLFMAKIPAWLDKMEAEDTTPGDSTEIAALLKHWYQLNKPGEYEHPTNNKNKAKIVRIRKVLKED